MNGEGLLVGFATFALIGIFHPIVIRGEYLFGTRCWPVFFVAGIASCVGSALTDGTVSVILGVLGFTCFWSIRELFQQRERVRKGWFPENPKRRKSAAIAGALPTRHTDICAILTKST